MSQTSIHSQRNTKWQTKPLITYDCPICMTINTSQLLELPCGHNVNKSFLKKNFSKTSSVFFNSYVYHVFT